MLTYHGVIRYHHRHTPEEDFQIIGQLGPACITRIHRDKYHTGRIQADLGAFEHELLQLGNGGQLYALHLLRHHWENFELDPVEFVETGPRPWKNNGAWK